MPRGQDTSRHEGRKVHRDTPRIASLLAEHLNETIVYPAQEQVDDMRQTLGYGEDYGGFTTDAIMDIADNVPGYIGEYTTESAQGLLNDYRDFRDRSTRPHADNAQYLGQGPTWMSKLDRAALEDYQSDLGGIIRNR